MPHRDTPLIRPFNPPKPPAQRIVQFLHIASHPFHQVLPHALIGGVAVDIAELVGVLLQVVELAGIARIEGELVGAGADHALVGDGEVAVESFRG